MWLLTEFNLNLYFFNSIPQYLSHYLNFLGLKYKADKFQYSLVISFTYVGTPNSSAQSLEKQSSFPLFLSSILYALDIDELIWRGKHIPQLSITEQFPG